jgi:hypothetical protein
LDLRRCANESAVNLRILPLLALVGCTSAPLHEVVTALHYEPDRGCGGGYVATICWVRADGWQERCWTGDVRDWADRDAAGEIAQ